MPATRYYDAHCHWQDARLLPYTAQIARDLETTGLVRAVVNGTCPQDWQAVADLALADARVLPAFGLHPWHVNTVCGQATKTTAADLSNPHGQRPAPTPPVQPTDWHWLETLKTFLAKFPHAAVGEIGLDNWIEGADRALQREAFLAQLALAATGNRPVSIHALRADADLLAALKAAPALPARGIHLHGFAGSVETARQLLDMGAYFSFSEYIAEPKRTKARAVAQFIPLDRLLAETDAPDMPGPPEWQHYRLGNAPAAASQHPLQSPATNSATPPPPKHPANITAATACLAHLRGLTIDRLVTVTNSNFKKLFL